MEAYGKIARPGVQRLGTVGPGDDRDVGELHRLFQCTQIPQLVYVSGVGTYETSFDFAGGAGGTPPQTARNTTRAWVNHRQLLPLDITAATADVMENLVNGRNSVQVEVTSSPSKRAGQRR